MENLFVRILNVTLLAAGFLALCAAIISALVAVVSYSGAWTANTSPQSVEVAYQPISVVGGSASLPTGSAMITPLDPVADSFCRTRNSLYSHLSSGKFRAADDCKARIIAVAQQFAGERAKNFLEQFTTYLQKAASDAQLSTKYPPTDSSETLDSYEQQIEQPFRDKFSTAATTDDQRRVGEEAKMASASARAWFAGTAAVSTFMSFLIIAFLIVAIRIEKHIGKIQLKLPTDAAAGSIEGHG